MALTLRLNDAEIALIEELKEKTQNKSASSALVDAANYYVNDKSRKDDELQELKEKIRCLNNKLGEYIEYFALQKKLSK